MKKRNFANQNQPENRFESPENLARWLASYPDYKDQIKVLREILGMTQEQLAKKVDRTPRSIRHIENGEAFPRITTLEKIAAALNAELKISLLPKEDISPFIDKEEYRRESSNSAVEKQSSYDNNMINETDIKIGETD